MSQKITFLLLVLLIATSCVDRQSQNEDPFRVKVAGQRQRQRRAQGISLYRPAVPHFGTVVPCIGSYRPL